VEDNQIETCYIKLHEILGFMKEKRTEFDKIREELNDNIKDLDGIINLLIAKDNEMRKDLDMTVLQEEIQILSHKVDYLLQLQKKNLSTDLIPFDRTNKSVSEIQEIVSDGNKTAIVKEEERSGNAKITGDYNNIELENAIKRFLQDYETQEMAGYINLTVMLEFREILSKNNLASWNEVKDLDNLYLVETARGQTYQAKHLNINFNNSNNCYLVAPFKLCQRQPYFNVRSVVEEAYLAFFDFDKADFTSRGNKGKLVEPAIFMKIDSMYKCVKRGKIQLL